LYNIVIIIYSLKGKINIYLPLILAIVLIGGIVIGYKLIPVITSGSGIFPFSVSRYNKLNDIVNYISQEYVDSIDSESISEKGIYGILDNLDPHSQYITAEDFNDVNDPLIGNFEGIGIQFRIDKDTIAVVQTITGGPSERAGLLAGDRIVTVDDTLVAGIKITDIGAMKKLKGKKGTKVRIEIFRRGTKNLIEFTITRDVIPTYSIDIAFMPALNIGYIKISKFSATTYNEFRQAIAGLKEQGMAKLILDLRGNAGGYLQAAIDISDEFLENNKLIVYTEGNHQPRESFYATSKGNLEKFPVVILIDEGTASASEIVAGALQDNDRGEIMGRRSFGKGLVQRQLDFPDGSALRLTVARYYTPTGRCIQKPYQKGKGFGDYYSEAAHRFLNGELVEKDSIHFNDSLKYITPGGKILYGGGGIMPDLFIPAENDPELGYYNQLLQNSIFIRFAFEYTDRNRIKLKQYTDFESFNEQFEINSVLFNDFLRFASDNGVEQNSKEIEFSSERIKTMLKANIGRNLFDDKGFYPLYLTTDKAYQKAISHLADDNN